jgi:sugar/nucleoside kinase (ribokinase family)
VKAVIDFLAIGHVTRDLLPDGGAAPGGTALYAALTAQRLGLRAAVYTAGAPAVDGIDWHSLPAGSPSTFENRYQDGRRRQWLHAAAPDLPADGLPPAWRNAAVVLLGPVLHEVEAARAREFPGSLVGMTPQGWLRDWDMPLPAPLRPRHWQPTDADLAAIDVLVLSPEDVGGDQAAAEAYAQRVPLGVVTLGVRGALMFRAGTAEAVAAYHADEVDPTGAGDVFTATLLIRLWEQGDAAAAARYAAAAAACAIEGLGTAALPDRSQVEARLAGGPRG